MLKNRKGVGAVKGLLAAGIGLGIIGIALAFVARITNTLATSVPQSSLMNNVTRAAAENATLGISEMAGWLPTVAIVVVAAFLIGFLVVAFRTR